MQEINYKEIIQTLSSRVLDNVEAQYLNDLLLDDEHELIKLIDLYITKDEINQQYIDNIYNNVNHLSTNIIFLIKKKIAQNIIYLFLEGNKQLFIDNFLYKKEIYNNLYYILSDYVNDVIIDTIKFICINFPKYSYEKELFECLKKFADFNYAKAINFIWRLSVKETFDMYEMAINNTDLDIYELLDSKLEKSFLLNKYMGTQLHDNHIICNNICNFTAKTLSYSTLVKLIISQLHFKCPKTINLLLTSAIKEENQKLINYISLHLSKKEVLRQLYAYNKPKLIHQFINENKNSYELKDLVVYY